jgi:hypothetical protein
VASPCGLIAKSYFNDEYQLYSESRKIFINETGIANQFDKDYTYKREADYNHTQWIDVENEHFMIWTRMETFPFFKKLWGIIDEDLPAGSYTFYIKNSKYSEINH